MKNRFLAGFAIVVLMMTGVLCAGVRAQTTDEGKGPTEHPSAPMEGGDPQVTQYPQAGRRRSRARSSLGRREKLSRAGHREKVQRRAIRAWRASA